MKKILNISLWLIITAGVMVLLSFAVADQKTVKCKNVNISIAGESGNRFLDENDIADIIIKKFDSLTGCYLDSINTVLIESVIASNPYVKRADVFKSVTGEIQVFVECHEPLVRIINKNGGNYYLSIDGTALPLSRKFTPRVIVASGNIDEDYNTIKTQNFKTDKPEEIHASGLPAIHYLSGKLMSHPFLNSYIEQIYINSNDDIELVPADGGYYIILGTPEDVDRKFYNLMAFYNAGKPAMEQGFNSLNLKYANQVICKK